MENEFYCNKCLKFYNFNNGGCYTNDYKHLTFCKPCMDQLISKDQKLGKDYVYYEPKSKIAEDHECCCKED